MVTNTYAKEKEQQIDEIKNHWFKDHNPTFNEFGGLTVLDWRKPETGIYSVRYVFDGCNMYVSGDLGDAVFRFTEKAFPERIARYNLDYFCEKLRAFSDAKRDFNQLEANQRLSERINEWENDCIVYDKEACDDLRREIDDSSSIDEFRINMAGFDYYRLGDDAWEWLGEMGSVIPMRLQSYLIGIQMAVGK